MESIEKTDDLTSLIIKEIENDNDFQKKFNEGLVDIGKLLVSNSDDENILKLQKELIEGANKIEQVAVTNISQDYPKEKQSSNLTNFYNKKPETVNSNNQFGSKDEKGFNKSNSYPVKRKSQHQAQANRTYAQLNQDYIDLAEQYRSEQVGMPSHHQSRKNLLSDPPIPMAYSKSSAGPKKRPEPPQLTVFGSSSHVKQPTVITVTAQPVSTTNQFSIPPSTTQTNQFAVYPTPASQSNFLQTPSQVVPYATALPATKPQANPRDQLHLISSPQVEANIREALSMVFKHEHETQIFVTTANPKLNLFYKCLRHYLTGLSTGLYGAKSELLARNTSFIEKMNHIGKFIFTAGVTAVPSIAVIAGTTGIALPIVSILMPVMIKLASFGWDKAIGKHIEIQIQDKRDSKLAFFGEGYDGADIFSATVALTAALCFQNFINNLSNENIYKFAEQWGKHFMESILEKKEAASHRLSDKLREMTQGIKIGFHHQDDLIYFNQRGYTFEALYETFFSEVNICFYNPDTHLVNAYGYIDGRKISLYFNSKSEADYYLEQTNKNHLKFQPIYHSSDMNYFYTLEWAERTIPHPETKKEVLIRVVDELEEKNKRIKERCDRTEEESRKIKERCDQIEQDIRKLAENMHNSNASQTNVAGSEVHVPPTCTQS